MSCDLHMNTGPWCYNPIVKVLGGHIYITRIQKYWHYGILNKKILKMALLNNPRIITVEYTLTNGILEKKILKMAFLNNPRIITVEYTLTNGSLEKRF